MRESLGRAYGEKSLNENLSPLFRFLRRQVGRPWDAVYAELSAEVRGASAVQQHVLDHVKQYVYVHVERDSDGVLHEKARRTFSSFGFRRSRPLLYVCPRTGILREVGERDLPQCPLHKKVDDGSYLVRVASDWYLVLVREKPPMDQQASIQDVFSGLSILAREHRERVWQGRFPWGHSMYAVYKRVLSRAERIAYFSKPEGWS